MADYNYIIEDHQELTGVGRRSHDQIDTILDYVLNYISNGGSSDGSGSWNNFSHEFTAADLANEVSPSVVRVALPAGMSLSNSPVIIGSIDGRVTEAGNGWQPSEDGTAIEIYIPTDEAERNLYLSAQPTYAIKWATPIPI